MRVADSAPPYDAVVFDCDSTLSAIEGVDELAQSAAERAQVERLTARAMAGEIALEDVYGRRLDLLQPARSAVLAVGQRYVDRALPHGCELVAALHALGKDVWIVSGGLLPAVSVLAQALGIPPEHVRAVDARFGADGAWSDFERASPLARAGGKTVIAHEIAAGSGARGLVVVGDGVTDLETVPPARRFVAFGGVARRTEVFERARVHCEQPDLAALVPLVLAEGEIEDLRVGGAHDQLLRAALPG